MTEDNDKSDQDFLCCFCNGLGVINKRRCHICLGTGHVWIYTGLLVNMLFEDVTPRPQTTFTYTH
jgi:hypothetical protein